MRYFYFLVRIKKIDLIQNSNFPRSNILVKSYWVPSTNEFHLIIRTLWLQNIIFSNIFGYVHTVFLFIALGHSCINPFIYFWTDARVRFGFLDLIGSIPGIKKCCRGVQWDNNFGRWVCRVLFSLADLVMLVVI